MACVFGAGMEQISGKDFRVTDEFDPAAFWQHHGSKIAWAGLALLGIGVAVFIWQRRVTQEMERAAASLAEARDIASLENVVRQYPGKEVAVQALLRLAAQHFQAGRYAEAGAAYQQLVDQFPQHPLVESALLGLAGAQEAQGNFADAKSKYARLITTYPNGYARVAAKLGEARCTESLGQLKEARQLYEEVLAQAQGTPWQPEAYLRYVVLGRELPPEPVSQAATPEPPAAATVPLQAPTLQLPVQSSPTETAPQPPATPQTN